MLMGIFRNSIKNILVRLKSNEYSGFWGMVRFLQLVYLKLFPILSFKKMSIISSVIHYYDLDSIEEFKLRYYISRSGFTELWNSRDRTGIIDIESFYQEHDKDIWRQAYMSRYSHRYKKKILSQIHLIRSLIHIHNTKILDYGCGAGVLANYLRVSGYDVDVADIASTTLYFIRKEMRFNNSFTIGKDTIPTANYDVITCLDVLEHTTNPLEITKKLITYLKPGGYFVVSFPVEDDFSCSHTRQAQTERFATFDFLERANEVLIPYRLFRKPFHSHESQ